MSHMIRTASTIRHIQSSFKKGKIIARELNSGALSCVKFNKYCITRGFPILRRIVFNNALELPKYFSSYENSSGTIDRLTFINVCTETLDSLSEYFEDLIESVPHLKNADVTYSDGVLTVYFGEKYGTYVINRQTLNSQIWLSSPTSGPKRYDFSEGTWIYKHDKTTLHSLLDKEIKEIANQKVEFVEKCMHAKANE